MTDIALTTTLAGVPVNGLADPPEITITRLDTDADVIAGVAMTDTGANGKYKFAFVPVAGLMYSFLIDADPIAAGQVDVRFHDGAFDNEQSDVWHDRGLNPAIPKTIDDNGVPDDADIDEDVAAATSIHKDVLTVGDVTTVTRI